MKLADKIFLWNRVLHRDLGYFCAVLTIIYCVSGIAINHIDQWNPNYKVERQNFQIAQGLNPDGDEIIASLRKELKIQSGLKNRFQSKPDTLMVFFEGHTIDLNLSSGKGSVESVVKRPLLHAFNFLHLNHAKKLWTWVADIFALMLLYLAVSGLFMIKGKKGLLGRGIFFVLAGTAVPVIFYFLYK